MKRSEDSKLISQDVQFFPCVDEGVRTQKTTICTNKRKNRFITGCWRCFIFGPSEEFYCKKIVEFERKMRSLPKSNFSMVHSHRKKCFDKKRVDFCLL